MLWTAPSPDTEVPSMRALLRRTTRSRQRCKRLRRSVATSPSRFSRFMASMLPATSFISKRLKRRYVLAFFQRLQPCLVGSRPALLRNLQSKALPALVATIVLAMGVPAYAAKNLPRNVRAIEQAKWSPNSSGPTGSAASRLRASCCGAEVLCTEGRASLRALDSAGGRPAGICITDYRCYASNWT